MNMASNVIVAKAKSMHGTQLKKEDYYELLRKKNVAEIAGYLKNETNYHDVLKDVRENNIHRGQLEDMLRRDYFKKTMKLFRYAEPSQKQYYWLHMQQIEIDLILGRLRVLISQGFEDAIAEFPIFLKSYTSYDLLKLGNVRTYDELLEVVKKTTYYDLLLTYRVTKGHEHEIDYTAIETQMQKQYYMHVFEVIDKTLRKKSRKSARELFASEVELNNITKIYRFKKFFQVREDVIRESLIPVNYHLSSSQLEEMISQQTTAGYLKLLKQCYYHLDVDEKEDTYIEYDTETYLYRIARRNIYYASDAPTVFSSYLLLIRRELENIINIIEGVRYRVDTEDIEKMLMY